MDEFDFVDEQKPQSDVRSGALAEKASKKGRSRRKRRLGGFTSRLGRGTKNTGTDDTDTDVDTALEEMSGGSSSQESSSSLPASTSLLSYNSTSSPATHDTSNAVILANDNGNASESVISKSEKSLPSTPHTPPTPPTPPYPDTPPSCGSKNKWWREETRMNNDNDNDNDNENSNSNSNNSENGNSKGCDLSDASEKRRPLSKHNRRRRTAVTNSKTTKRQASSSSSSSSYSLSLSSTTSTSDTTSFTSKIKSLVEKRGKQSSTINSNHDKVKEQKYEYDNGVNDEGDEGDEVEENEYNDEDDHGGNEDDDEHDLPPSPRDVQVTGAGTDVFAVQDAGSFRLVQDDCAYLCSSFLSSIGADNRDRNTAAASDDGDDDRCNNCDQNDSNKNTNRELMKNVRQSSSITAGAACDLALMLSCKKTRDDLIKLGSGVENEFSQESFLSDPTEDINDAVQGVLDVLSLVPPSFDGSRLPPSFLHMDGDGDRDVQRESSTSTSARSGYDLIVVEALSLLANFFSFDCTQNTKYSASPSPAAAASFRKSLLRHAGAMRGIAR